MIHLDASVTARSSHHTGIQRVVRELWKAAKSKGPSRAIVWDGSIGTMREARGLEVLRLERFFDRGIHRWRFLARIHARRQLKERRKPDPGAFPRDGVWLMPEIPPPAILGWYRAVLDRTGPRASLVGCVHDLFTYKRAEWTPPERVAGFEEYLQTLAGFDLVTTPSAETREDLTQYWREKGLRGPSVRVCPWAVEPPEGNRREVDPPMVLSVGTLEARKNHDVLLDACEGLWDEGKVFRLVLIGRQRSRADRALVGRIEAMEEAGRPVRWKGVIRDEDLWRAYREAARAGAALAATIRALRIRVPDRPVHAIAHSFGARVVLSALGHLEPGALGRVILLAGAEFGHHAAEALATPAGRAAEIINVTTRENDLYDFLLECLIAPPARGDRSLGLALPSGANVLTLQLDDPDTLAVLRGAGFGIAPPAARICHWSPYTRPGALPFYGALLRAPERLSLAQLRAALPERAAPRWSRILAEIPLPMGRKASF